ncbi:MAG: DNA-binding protein [Bacteroides sp.]|nr:DNA-binding protein [Bacteroides sp.]
MAIPVQRYKRHTILGDETSPELFYLKREPGHERTYLLEDAAAEIETTSALSQEDVIHVMKAFVRRLRIILTQGDKLKVEGLGTFFPTFSCQGTEEEKDCTVRNIQKVHVRFAVDNTLRLVNDSIASTRGGANNVQFYIKGETESSNSSNNNQQGGNDRDDDNIGGNDNGGGFVNPAAYTCMIMSTSNKSGTLF